MAYAGQIGAGLGAASQGMDQLGQTIMALRQQKAQQALMAAQGQQAQAEGGLLGAQAGATKFGISPVNIPGMPQGLDPRALPYMQQMGMFGGTPDQRKEQDSTVSTITQSLNNIQKYKDTWMKANLQTDPDGNYVPDGKGGFLTKPGTSIAPGLTSLPGIGGMLSSNPNFQAAFPENMAVENARSEAAGPYSSVVFGHSDDATNKAARAIIPGMGASYQNMMDGTETMKNTLRGKAQADVNVQLKNGNQLAANRLANQYSPLFGDLSSQPGAAPAQGIQTNSQPGNGSPAGYLGAAPNMQSFTPGMGQPMSMPPTSGAGGGVGAPAPSAAPQVSPHQALAQKIMADQTADQPSKAWAQSILSGQTQ